MKKILLCLSLLLIFVLVAVACGGDNPPADTTDNTTNETVADATVAGTDVAVEETEETPTSHGTTDLEEPTVAVDETPTEAPAETVTEAPTEPETEPDPTIPAHVIDAEQLSVIPADDQSYDLSSEGAVVLNDGYVTFTPDGGDPYYYPDRYFFGARYIIIKYRTTNADGAMMQVYLDSYTDGPKDDSTMLQGALIGDGEWHYLVLDTQPLIDAADYDGQYVSHLRFDPLESGYVLDENGDRVLDEDKRFARLPLPEGASVDVAYIAFCHAEDTMQNLENPTEDDNQDQTPDIENTDNENTDDENTQNDATKKT